MPEAIAQASKASQLRGDLQIGITLADVPATNTPGARRQRTYFACDAFSLSLRLSGHTPPLLVCGAA